MNRFSLLAHAVVPAVLLLLRPFHLDPRLAVPGCSYAALILRDTSYRQKPQWYVLHQAAWLSYVFLAAGRLFLLPALACMCKPWLIPNPHSIVLLIHFHKNKSPALTGLSRTLTTTTRF
ncbi:hypothetical protein [Rheinheimera sp. MM224]|uniref:hypothetical protein n=1 Tax=Rheinheimera sp. MM224 TaxID=3019969 RepID=UPI0021F8C120|nr:hypothetical protein [Rheinheimera sp. MM224]CAI3795771.1 hypothetical protein JAMGFMIE_01401 [Rheinheimera sp. MM224]CAI3795933.1 hypothetical protein JAMGFMIE_01441 [Rheinheimera sp. MM224]